MHTFLHLSSSVALALTFTACLAGSESETKSPIGGDTVCIQIYPECPAGQAPADTDGDGCALECAPIVCPAIAVECPAGQVPADTDGDGCAFECRVFGGNNP